MNDMILAAAQSAGVMSPCVSEAPAIVPGRHLHIDGDMIAYWAGGGEGMPVSTSRHIALGKIEALGRQCGADQVVVHLTAASSSKADRFLISTVKPYQGQRKSGRKPANWGYLRDWMENYGGHSYRVKLWATREADDGLAFMAYHYKGQHVICTKDKDMRMLPGWHMDWDDMSLHFVPVGSFDGGIVKGLQFGHLWFWQQLLQGDTADNIPGLPKLGNAQCGPATAVKYLSKVTNNAEAYDFCQEAYELHYAEEWPDRMVEQALLLWLRTDREASTDNVFHILPRVPKLQAAVDRINKRIKEKYDEAHRITGVSPARQDA